MNCFPRNVSVLAATATVAVMLAGPAPVFAAEQAAAATDISAKASSTHIRRHGPVRVAHYVRPVRPADSNYGCSGVWCGRQFVLMIGIGF